MGARCATASATLAFALVVGDRRASARRRFARWAAGRDAQVFENADAAGFDASLDRVVAHLREIDELRSSVCSGRFPVVSSSVGLGAVRELEDLAAPRNVDKAVRALEEAIGGPVLDGDDARVAAQAAAAALGLDGTEVLRAAAEALGEGPSFGEPPQLSEAEQRLVEALRDQARAATSAASVRARSWPPPPPLLDDSQEAQAARLQAITALAEAQRDARAGPPGASELPPLPAAAPQCASLASLLAAAGESPLALEGDGEARISGCMDAEDLLRPGDAAVIVLPSGPSRDEAVEEALLAARSAGASAMVLLGASPEDAAKAAGWLATGGLQALALLEAPDAAPRLASAFWGKPGARAPCLLALGSDSAEVRTAAWLLASATAYQLGSAKAAALSSRRAYLGRGAVDVGHALTPCVVQELLAQALVGGAEVCVLEALPGAQTSDAFAGLEFEVAVSLDDPSGIRPLAKPLDCAAQLLRQTRSGGVVSVGSLTNPAAGAGAFCLGRVPQAVSGVPKSKQPVEAIESVFRELGAPCEEAAVAGAQLSAMKDRGLGMSAVPCYTSEMAERMDELMGMSSKQLLEVLEEGGDPQPEGMKPKKSALVRKVWSLEADAAAEDTVAQADPPAGVLSGKVLPATSVDRMSIALAMKDHGTATVSLPLLGISGARAALAAASAALAWRRGAAGGEGELEWLRGALESSTAPPGTLEVLTGQTPPSAVAVLHEASTPEEVRRALTLVRGWLRIDKAGEEATPRLTAVLGCQGELARGDRAKYGWALAELCDSVVLTSDQPRAEPPLQILEDILSAVRSRAPRMAGCFSASPRADNVHVVADRADAIKLGACLSARQPPTATKEAGPPGVLVVFGSSHGDSQAAAGPDGEVRNWLCHDRRVILEALESVERLSGLALSGLLGKPFDVTQVPWRLGEKPSAPKEAVSSPGPSLHWTHLTTVASSDVRVSRPL